MLQGLKSKIGNRSPIRLGWHFAKAFISAARFGFPARKLIVIGITGTDGKTTTTGMLTHILLQNGVKVGAASTAYFQINHTREENPTHLTSIKPYDLQKFLRRLVREDCTHAVIEMASHGLVQGRAHYTWPAVSAITNTDLEHLDYHGTMEQYRKDKGKIFEMLKGPQFAFWASRGKRGTKVLNAGDETFEMYSQIASEKTIVYGVEGRRGLPARMNIRSDGGVGGRDLLLMTDVEATTSGCEGTIVDSYEIRNTKYEIRIPVPGTFNLENALCAISCAQALGISIEDSCTALSSFQPIDGRMEQIDEGQDFSVFVDFTVSPQAYEKVLETLRKVVEPTGNKVLVLCSSCGNRMAEKRPIIGETCSRMADTVVVTEDETYGEDPEKVMEEVWSGIDQSACSAHKIFDRREAIEFLFQNANPGDAVALCGMGPFSTFTRLEGRVEWDEREVAREILRNM